MKKYLLSISALLVLPFMQYTFAAECTLATVPSPSIDAYTKNIEKILEEAKKLAASSTCTKSEGAPSYLDVAIPAQSIQALIGNLESVGYDIGTLLSETRYYFDGTGMLLPEVQQHQSSILEIQNKILQASTYIGSRCAQGVIEYPADVPLENSQYSTKGKTIQEVLHDTYLQTRHVLVFFRNLSTNVADEEYTDETLFSIAPKGFAKDMRGFYSSENLQKCHDEEPKNKKILEIIKEAFTTGWKYPQAIQIWKDAFALLLYRGGQVGGNDSVDKDKNAEISSIVEAQKGGLGNSRFLLNSQFFKEFGRRANNQTIQEVVKDTAKRIAYETFGSLFQRQTVPDIKRASGGVANIVDFPTFGDDAVGLAEIDRGLYDDYARRKVLVGQDKAQNPETVTGLVQGIEQLEKARPLVEENAQLACDSYRKQGQNLDKGETKKPTCLNLMNI